MLLGSNIGENKIAWASARRISAESNKRIAASRVYAGDLVTVRVGAPGITAVIPPELDGCNCASVMIVRRGATFDSRWLSYLMNSPVGIAQVENVQYGTAQKQFNISDAVDFLYPTPQLKEQRAIATALSDADALIESLEQLLTKKRHIKQGAMQELLTGKRRLPGFEGEWRAKAMHTLGQTFGGLTGKTKADFGRGNAKFIPFMNVMKGPAIDPAWLESVDVKQGESQNVARAGDLFFNGSSETPEEVGFCSMLMDEIPDLYLNSFCFGFRFHPETRASGLFLAYWFRSRDGRKAMALLAQGATRYNIAKSAFLKLEIPQPSALEQSAIADVLRDMDAEIAALETKLTKARQIKQGMMQELLTGRIRLVPPHTSEAQ